MMFFLDFFTACMASSRYHFLKDSSASSQPQRLAACLELAGLLGDVTLGRFEACWMRQGPLLGGRWQLRGELGVAKALGGSTLPLEDWVKSCWIRIFMIFMVL